MQTYKDFKIRKVLYKVKTPLLLLFYHNWSQRLLHWTSFSIRRQESLSYAISSVRDKNTSLH